MRLSLLLIPLSRAATHRSAVRTSGTNLIRTNSGGSSVRLSRRSCTTRIHFWRCKIARDRVKRWLWNSTMVVSLATTEDLTHCLRDTSSTRVTDEACDQRRSGIRLPRNSCAEIANSLHSLRDDPHQRTGRPAVRQTPGLTSLEVRERTLDGLSSRIRVHLENVCAQCISPVPQ